MYLFILSLYPLVTMMEKAGLASVFLAIIFIGVFYLVPATGIVYLLSAWLLQKFAKKRLTADIWFLAKLDIIATIILTLCYLISKTPDLSIIISIIIPALGLASYRLVFRLLLKKPLATHPQKTTLLKSIGRWTLALLCCFGLLLVSFIIGILITQIQLGPLGLTFPWQ